MCYSLMGKMRVPFIDLLDRGALQTGLYIRVNAWAIKLVLTPPRFTEIPEQNKYQTRKVSSHVYMC